MKAFNRRTINDLYGAMLATLFASFLAVTL